MEGRAQQVQQRYFEEYQRQCAANPQAMMDELARWEAGDATILDVGMAEQAAYADYVTRKVCTEQPEEIIVATSLQLLGPQPPVKQNSCAIGNTALLVQTVLAMEGHDQLKNQLRVHYQALIAQQREIRANPQQSLPADCSVQ